jgi:hypothetical protein
MAPSIATKTGPGSSSARQQHGSDRRLLGAALVATSPASFSSTIRRGNSANSRSSTNNSGSGGNSGTGGNFGSNANFSSLAALQYAIIGEITSEISEGAWTGHGAGAMRRGNSQADYDNITTQAQFCNASQDPGQLARLTAGYNIIFSFVLSPIGFLLIFIVDARKRGCQCSEKVVQEDEAPGLPIPPEDKAPALVRDSDLIFVGDGSHEDLQTKNSKAPGPSFPSQMTMTENQDVEEQDWTSKTKELKNIPFLGISEYYQSAANLLYNVTYRVVFVIMQLRGQNFINPALFIIDICMATYFGYKKMYCPGCLYNDIHVLAYKRKFVHVSEKI